MATKCYGEKCDSPIFTEEELKQIVVKEVNKLYEIKDDVLLHFLALRMNLIILIKKTSN